MGRPRLIARAPDENGGRGYDPDGEHGDNGDGEQSPNDFYSVFGLRDTRHPVEATLERAPRVRLGAVHRIALGNKSRPEFVLDLRFAVHQPYRSEPRRLVFDVGEPRLHFSPVGVSAVAIDHLDTRLQRYVLAKYLKHGLSLDDSSPERPFSIIPDAAMITIGPCARESAFDSSTSRV